MADIVKVGGFCPNPDCPKHEQTKGNEIIRHGWTGQGKQRFRCKCCGQSFNENRGTLFYRKRTPEKDITEALAMLADGSGVNSVSRVKGVTADTVVAWQREAGLHAGAVSDVLLGGHEAGPSQVDGLWSFVVHKGSKKNLPETPTEGTFWRTTVLEIATRLRVAQGLEKSETEATEQAFRQLQGRANPDAPPPLISDGWGGIDQALIEVYGYVPVYTGRGRPPTLKRPGEGWLYVMIIKHRDSTGRLTSVEHKVVLGDETLALATLGHSTAYVERTHLTMRTHGARLTRKGLQFSKDVLLHRAAAAWDDLVYNVARPLRTLRQRLADEAKRRWWPRTPAMAAGLTDRIWSIGDILRAVPAPV